MTSNSASNKFIEDNYKEIILMAKKIVKNEDAEEVAHYVIEQFLYNPKAKGLIERKEALKYFSGMIHLSYHSSTSPYHKLYRQSGKVYGLRPGWEKKVPIEEEYDEELDKTIDMIETLLQEMEADNIDRWYKSVLFRMYIDCPNYSELERRTGIPRTSISFAVKECREYIKNKLK